MFSIPARWTRIAVAVCVLFIVLNLLSSAFSSGSDKFDYSVAEKPSKLGYYHADGSKDLLKVGGQDGEEKAREKPDGKKPAGDQLDFDIDDAPINKAEPPKLEQHLRKYFDSRDNGLFVVLLELGDPNVPEYETHDIKQIIKSNKKKNKFNVVMVKGYDYASMQSQVLFSQSSGGIHDSQLFLEFRKLFIDFLEGTWSLIEAARPSVGGINDDAHYSQAKASTKYIHRNGRVPVYGGHWRESYMAEPVRTEEYLLHFLRITTNEKNALQKSHSTFMETRPKAFPGQLLKAGKKFGFMEGDGIVYLGGGKYNQLVLLSISLLRNTGCKLPIEVILPTREDYDLDLCNNILPSFNGRCKVMSDFLPSKLVGGLKNFQLKSMALLVSSFKNVLYLDADNLPVKNPDYLFVNAPFTEKHMIVWPDLWRRSTSPNFYEIADIEIDPNWQMRNSYFPGDKRGATKGEVSLHDTKGTIPEASSETGQFMINKEVHFATLILSLYYNYYGFDYYYPLLSQGAAGEGDKDTFIAAAHKLDLPYYQVMEFNREFGPEKSNKKHEYFGMGQYDPIVDYNNNEFGFTNKADTNNFANDNEDPSKLNYDFHYFKTSSLMFLHANWPKFYIDEMFGVLNSNGRGPKDANGNRRRLYTDYLKKETNGYDFELDVMKHAEAWFCKGFINLHGLSGPESPKRKKACESIRAQIDYLKG